MPKTTKTPQQYTCPPEALRAFDESVVKCAKREPLALTDAMNIAGVISGIKPAALIDGDLTDRKALKSLNLFSSPSAYGLLAVSRDATTAKKLSDAHIELMTDKGRDADLHRDIGRLLGYPPTAINYFLKRIKTMDTAEELPMVRVRSRKYIKNNHFQQLILSPKYWQQELATYCEPLEEAMCANLPKSYRAVVRRSNRERRAYRVRKFFRLVPRYLEQGPYIGV